MKEPAPFFIGWESKPPASLSRFMRVLVGGFLVLAALIGLGSAVWQSHIGNATWDLTPREFTGVLIDSPTPMLLTPKPHYLVSEGKFGFPPAEAKQLHLRQVKVRGTLLRDEDAMIEVVGKVEPLGPLVAANSLPAASSLGPVTLRGEIVDSKCYLGAMNPGIGKPHRACAIHCLRGGIPPVVLTPDRGIVLLVGAKGEAVNAAILDYVAEPVEVSGELKQIGELTVIFADLASLRRL